VVAHQNIQSPLKHRVCFIFCHCHRHCHRSRTLSRLHTCQMFPPPLTRSKALDHWTTSSRLPSTSRSYELATMARSWRVSGLFLHEAPSGATSIPPSPCVWWRFVSMNQAIRPDCMGQVYSLHEGHTDNRNSTREVRPIDTPVTVRSSGPRRGDLGEVLVRQRGERRIREERLDLFCHTLRLRRGARTR
jgi:hypothetical protein